MEGCKGWPGSMPDEGLARRVIQETLGWGPKDQHFEDVLQEVVTRLWLARSAYDSSQGKWSTFTHEVARNECLQFVRSKRYRPVQPADHSGRSEF
jgi:DNA-directed RNA polymerase specialized sigma24 family protein